MWVTNGIAVSEEKKMGMFKNPELKGIVIKIIILQLLFSAALFFVSDSGFKDLNSELTQRNQALAGKILLMHPELERDIIGIITQQATSEEINYGKQILKQYGYDLNLETGSQPLLRKIYISVEARTILFALLWLVPIIALILFEYGKLYKKVRRISKASEKVIEGSLETPLPESGEGDFDILGHQFNQMSQRLIRSVEREKQDKIFLKETISNISHQLKTPLSSLLTFNELMLDQKDMDETTRQDFLEKSKAQLVRMEWLIANLLKLARLEAGAILFKKDNLDLRQLVDASINVLSPKIAKKDINITVENSSAVWLTADCDWTSEAVVNIIKNCIEHTDVGGSIGITLSETPLFSSISIKDNGCGINSSDLPHIFERFYRGNSNINTEGIGIGLSIAKLIIEGQNGTITVKSTLNKGTEFVITLLKTVV